MKAIIPMSPRTLPWLAATAGVLLAGLANAESTQTFQTRQFALRKGGSGIEDENKPPGGSGAGRKAIKIESIEPIRGKEAVQEVSWLGVSTEEAPEALASQLGLKSGQGLVVIYVATESPAAKAGLQKHDVLAELDDQLLVHPVQLRKLIQMRKEGDPVKLTLHRAGKKQTVSAKLAKRTEVMGMFLERQILDGSLPKLDFEPAGGKMGDRVHEHLKILHGSLTGDGVDKPTVNVEVRRNMDEVRKAIQEALRHATPPARATPPVLPVPPQKSVPKVDIADDATVTVKQDGVSGKTIVKSDDAGVYVIVASPRKHLTVHDKDGKLLFDGEIESQEGQQKVPAKLWEKVKPMLDQIKPADKGATEPQAQFEGEPKI
jgi:hypothetical protein